ncbi:uncharacterized protein LOC110448340 [Mizuhopecten yessoensis]|uniref:uncharacterized protein LOC110448340 n=1 Tax=Mizuhopecten yessoensis TaxID=6573 RepID=UPI000B457428|nr:uncharacterized protein LOC110448340 [Mizuhopecten yessoensis]
MNGVLAVLACMVVVTVAMTTTTAPHHHHGHHGTHPPHIGEGFVFKYDQNSHRMAVVSHQQCWIYNPSDAERSTISDIHALRNLEVKLIQLIDNTPIGTPMTHDDLALMSTPLAHTCKADWPIVSLN